MWYFAGYSERFLLAHWGLLRLALEQSEASKAAEEDKQ